MIVLSLTAAEGNLRSTREREVGGLDARSRPPMLGMPPFSVFYRRANVRHTVSVADARRKATGTKTKGTSSFKKNSSTAERDERTMVVQIICVALLWLLRSET